MDKWTWIRFTIHRALFWMRLFAITGNWQKHGFKALMYYRQLLVVMRTPEKPTNVEAGGIAGSSGKSEVIVVRDIPISYN